MVPSQHGDENRAASRLIIVFLLLFSLLVLWHPEYSLAFFLFGLQNSNLLAGIGCPSNPYLDGCLDHVLFGWRIIFVNLVGVLLFSFLLANSIITIRYKIKSIKLL
jgi:hypothetical protein